MIDKSRKIKVLIRLAIALIACQDQDQPIAALLERVPDRNSVANASIHHRHAIHISDRAKDRQRARGLADRQQTIPVPLLLQIFGLARQAIAHHHLESLRRLEEGVIIERIIALRINIENVIQINIPPASQEMAPADVIVMLQQVDVAETRAAALSRDIRDAITRSCRDTDRIGKTDAMIHKAIEHADGEDAAHAASLQNQSRTLTDADHNTPFVLGNSKR